MTEIKILKTAKVSDLDQEMQQRLQNFLQSCEADGLYCKISEDGTRIVLYKDAEKTIPLRDFSVALYRNLQVINS